MAVLIVKRRHRNLLSLDDVIERDTGERERVVDMTSPTLVRTVPERRRDRSNVSTLSVFWRDLRS